MKLLLLFFVGCGLTQFLLLPGFIWNFTFPLIIISSTFIIINRKRLQTSRFWSLLLLALVVLIGVELTQNHLLEERLSPPRNQVELKILTYNVFFKNKSHKSCLDLIRRADPDIIVIQELTPQWSSSIRSRFQKSHPFILEIPLKGTHGIGIYSRHKLLASESLVNSSNMPFAQVVKVNVSGKYIQIINTHLASPAIALENPDRFIPLFYQNYQLRKKQLREINSLAMATAKKYDSQFLVGDLNTMKHEPIFKTLEKSWVNTYSEKGKLFKASFPNSSRIRPIITLDYILVRGRAECIQSEILSGGSSDHLALVSTFNI